MNKIINLFNKEYLILTIILVLAFTARLYRIDSPLADWHSWRQADTSAVTRRYLVDGIDLLHPRYDDLSSIPSGLDNPEGFRFVEFPLVNALTAKLYQALPIFSLEIWGRLTSIFFSLGAILFLYKIADRYLTKPAAYLSALIFALLPFNLYYHRTILPEVPLVFLSLLSLFSFSRWLDRRKPVWLLLASLASALAFLLKPIFGFLLIPLGYLAYRKFGLKLFRQKFLYFYLVISLAPFLLWRWWISQFPEGIPAFTWLLNGTGIRFRPAFFRWLFADRIGRLIFGYFGLIPLALGLVRKPDRKAGWFFHWWLAAVLIYLIVFATGNVTHDYYQIFIIPPLAVFAARGVEFLAKLPAAYFNRYLGIVVALVSLLFCFGFSWYFIRDFYNINHPEIVAAGQAADKILPAEAKVIAPYQGDTAFLYQTKRQGWPIGGAIKDKIDQGATDYVSVSLDEETRFLLEHCKPSISLDQFTLISLRSCSL